MIELKGVAKWYGDVVALSEVTAEIGSGLTALLGPNGAGKSSLIRIICGLTSPSRGSVRVLGRDPRRDPTLHDTIGIVPQQEHLIASATALQFVGMAAALHGRPDPDGSARAAIETVQLDPADKRRLRTYSKGMRQRVKLAQALVHDPKVLVLDEPLNGLDPRQRARMSAIFLRLAEEGRSVIVSSHVLEEVEELGSTVLMLADGKLAAEGNFHTIRKMLDDRPHRIRVRCSNPRAVAAGLVSAGLVSAVQFEADDGLVTDTSNVSEFRHGVLRFATSNGISLREIKPLDDDLESVFRYLVARRG